MIYINYIVIIKTLLLLLIRNYSWEFPICVYLLNVSYNSCIYISRNMLLSLKNSTKMFNLWKVFAINSQFGILT